MLKYKDYDANVAEALQEYYKLKNDNQEFLAARFIVDIVHTFTLGQNNAQKTNTL